MNLKNSVFLILPMICPLAFGDAGVPHLWWGHKVLAVDVGKCVLKSQIALLENEFKSISVNNEYHFLYATKDDMRVGVQCLAQHDGSFVYVNVAGSNVGLVEESRNKLISSIK